MRYVTSHSEVHSILCHSHQISRASSALGQKIASSTEPIRNTEAYKTLADTVMDALDDSGSAKHAGYKEKEVRRARRQMRLAKAGRSGGIGKERIREDPEYVIYPVSYFHKYANLPQCWLLSGFARKLCPPRKMDTIQGDQFPHETAL